jgi:hypothetical protein
LFQRVIFIHQPSRGSIGIINRNAQYFKYFGYGAFAAANTAG